MSSVARECVVIGAGVVGLAVAACLSRRGYEVILLEREKSFGTVTSSRNSEVIHAGIYYRPGSLKARLCVRGKQALYAYCKSRHIDHRRCGKLIVATSDSQLQMLGKIRANATANGVSDLSELSAERAQNLEPALQCTGALLSPSTGIIDSHAFMLSLLGDAENHGAIMVGNAFVQSISYDETNRVYTLHIDNDGPTTLQSPFVVNAAGHGACAVASSILQMPEAKRPEAIYLKGNYFRLDAAAPFSRLVYPVPEEGGLGVHITLDLAGMARFGPDVEPISTEDYAVNPQRAMNFYAAVRNYWPELPDGVLLPDYSGIRPRIRYQQKLHDDFLIQLPQEHGLPGLINLFGIESPGLTASLALAEYVADNINHQ